ncbi:MAG: hypothetical protein NTX52_02380, partial [Planctomycetota bacterium]|nr:hypothetical protein [Planctomycetota bacterium]
MARIWRISKTGLTITGAGILFVFILSTFAADEAVCKSQPQALVELGTTPSAQAELNLKEIPFKIVYETYRQTNGKENWELYLMNADGSNPVNLTNTPDMD